MLGEIEHRFGSRDFVGVHARVEADWEGHCAASKDRSDNSHSLFGNRHQCWVRKLEMHHNNVEILASHVTKPITAGALSLVMGQDVSLLSMSLACISCMILTGLINAHACMHISLHQTKQIP